jgi:hypothetical protein
MSLPLERIDSASRDDCCACFGDSPEYLKDLKIPNYMVAHKARSEKEERHLIDINCLLQWTQSLRKTQQEEVPCPTCRQWIDLNSFDFSRGKEKSIFARSIKIIYETAEKCFLLIGICFAGYYLSCFMSHLAVTAANSINSDAIGTLLQNLLIATISFIVGLGAKENGATPIQGFVISCIIAIGLLGVNSKTF